MNAITAFCNKFCGDSRLRIGPGHTCVIDLADMEEVLPAC